MKAKSKTKPAKESRNDYESLVEKYSAHLGPAPHGVVVWGCRDGEFALKLADWYTLARVAAVDDVQANVVACRRLGLDVRLGTMKSSPFPTGRKFDGAVLHGNYLSQVGLTNESLITSLRTARSILHRGSKLIASVFHTAAAATHDFDPASSLLFSYDGEEVMRTLTPTEAKLALGMSGFKPLAVASHHATDDNDRPIGLDDHSFLIVAEAV